MWSLIVVIAGLIPPQGMIQYGFQSKEACIEEARSYCSGEPRQFLCRCEKGLLPPGSSPRPEPQLKHR